MQFSAPFAGQPDCGWDVTARPRHHHSLWPACPRSARLALKGPTNLLVLTGTPQQHLLLGMQSHCMHSSMQAGLLPIVCASREQREMLQKHKHLANIKIKKCWHLSRRLGGNGKLWRILLCAFLCAKGHCCMQQGSQERWLQKTNQNLGGLSCTTTWLSPPSSSTAP